MMKRSTMILLLLALLGVGACDSQQSQTEPAQQDQQQPAQQAQPAQQDDQIPDDQTMQGPTEGGNFYVVITPEPNPIPFQELFELEVEVYASEAKAALVEGVELDQLRATMPAHGHGMNTEPRIHNNDDGTFTVEGMRFHMQGEGEHGRWVVETVLNHNGTIDQARFDVQCCRE